jgi:hypothetical protein
MQTIQFSFYILLLIVIYHQKKWLDRLRFCTLSFVVRFKYIIVEVKKSEASTIKIASGVKLSIVCQSLGSKIRHLLGLSNTNSVSFLHHCYRCDRNLSNKLRPGKLSYDDGLRVLNHLHHICKKSA